MTDPDTAHPPVPDRRRTLITAIVTALAVPVGLGLLLPDGPSSGGGSGPPTR